MSMQRRIKAPPKESAVYQALIDHKEATLRVILARIPDFSTFAQLGELSGYGNGWYRLQKSCTRMESVIRFPKA